MKTKEEIKKRISEVQKKRDNVTGNVARSKYGYVIGELLWVLDE